MYIATLYSCKVTKISWNIGLIQPNKCPFASYFI